MCLMNNQHFSDLVNPPADASNFLSSVDDTLRYTLQTFNLISNSLKSASSKFEKPKGNGRSFVTFDVKSHRPNRIISTQSHPFIRSG